MTYTAAGKTQRFYCNACGRAFSGDALRYTPERVGYLDIEASQLVADFGHMISWAVKERGGPVYSAVLKERSLPEEKRIIQLLLETLRGFDRVVTYNGVRFDIPFIRTRMFHHGLHGLDNLYHTDLYFVAKHRLRTSSKRLDRVTEFLGIKGKTPLQPATWVAASFGDKKAMRYILKHNIGDVKILEKLDERLEPYYKMNRRYA